MGEPAIKDAEETKEVQDRQKRLSDFRNLPAVCVEDGRELGNINAFIFDLEKKCLVGFILPPESPGGGLRVMPFSAVSNFGAFAVTVTSSGEVDDLSANRYFRDLYEQGLRLLGSKVCLGNEDEEIVGYVRDVAFRTRDGGLVSLNITTDAGFTSPFSAEVPFEKVADANKERIRLLEEYSPDFHREGPMGRSSGKSYVPLAVLEPEWRRALSERVGEESEKLFSNLRDRLTEEFVDHFLAHTKDRMQEEIADLLRGELQDLNRKNIQEAIEKDLTERNREIIQRALDSFQERMTEQISDQIRGMPAEDEPREPVEPPDIGEQLDVFLKKKFDSADEEISRRVDSSADALKNRLRSAMEESIRSLKQRLAIHEAGAGAEVEDKAEALSFAIEEFDRRLNNSVDDLKQITTAALSETLSNLRKEFAKKPVKILEDAAKVQDSSLDLKEKKKRLMNTATRYTDETRIEAAGKIAEVFRRFEVESESLKNEVASHLATVREDVEQTLSLIRDAFVERARKLAETDEEDLAEFENTRKELEKRIKALSDGISQIKPDKVRDELLSSLSGLHEDISGMLLERNRELSESVDEIFDSMVAQVVNCISESMQPEKLDERLGSIEERLEALAEAQGKIRDLLDTHSKELSRGVPSGDLQAEAGSLRDMLVSELDELRSEFEQLIEEYTGIDPAKLRKPPEQEKPVEPPPPPPPPEMPRIDLDSVKEEIDTWRAEAEKRLFEHLESKMSSLQPPPSPPVEVTPDVEREKDEVKEEEKAEKKKEGHRDKRKAKIIDAVKEEAQKRTRSALDELRDIMEQRVAEAKGEILSSLRQELGGLEPADTQELKEILLRDIMASLRKGGLFGLFSASTGEGEGVKLNGPATEEEAFNAISGELEKSMIGKTAARDIITEGGRRLVSKGEDIDENVIQRAKDHGKLIELSLNFED